MALLTGDAPARSRVAVYDRARADVDTFAPAAAEAVAGGQASYAVRAYAFLADRNGRLGADVSHAIASGRVTVDYSADVPSTFAADVVDPEAIPAYSWLAPVLSVAWWQPGVGEQEVTAQVGLFLVLPPSVAHTAAMGSGQLDGRDPTYLLTQDFLGAGASFAQGANVVAAVRSVIEGAGFTRHRIVSKSSTFRKKRAYDPGKSRLEVVNDLLMRIGYYPLYADRQGLLSSQAIRPVTRVDPFRRISSADGDVIATVTLETNADQLINQVTVIKNDPDEPIRVTKTNSRADSPSSTVGLGFVKEKVIEAANIDTAAEATALANEALEDGGKVLAKLSVTTIPDPAWIPRRPVHAVIARDDGTPVASGRWSVDRIELELAPSEAPMRWSLSKLVPWED